MPSEQGIQGVRSEKQSRGAMTGAAASTVSTRGKKSSVARDDAPSDDHLRGKQTDIHRITTPRGHALTCEKLSSSPVG